MGRPADAPIQALAYTIKQAAEALGVGETLVRALIAQRRIPHCRLGDRVIVPLDSLAAWLASEAASSVKPEPFEVNGQ
jgi:excisionase family DNA binding protein